MSGKYQYQLSFRVRHPSLSAGAITEGFELDASIAHSVGDARVTPKGNELGGVWEETCWTSNVTPSGTIDLERAMSDVLAGLSGRHHFLQHIRATGGKAELLVGWFFEAHNCALELDYRLMQQFAQFGVDLSLDAYGSA